jgi:hypothetical protein
MRLLHIANTDLELELTQPHEMPLEQALRRNPVVHQLQFLPLLYAEEGDGIYVTDAPYDMHSPMLIQPSQLKESTCDRVESWGASRCITKWAPQHNLKYHVPTWDVVREVSSKAFSFQQVDPLPNAALITSWEALETWMQKVDGPKVLKSCFGLSGQGHLLLPAPREKIKAFADRELNASRPLIAEPWVVRKLDFSTQWMINLNQSISYLGATILISDAKGRYAGTIVGPEEEIFGAHFAALQNHKASAMRALKKMASLGFFGNVGIDAMIWGDDILHPVVEINARKTMGWVALQIAKRLFPNQTIQVNYKAADHAQGLLPRGIIKPDGKVVRFQRNLFANALA